MITSTAPAAFVCTPKSPATVYYCKAGIPTGTTCRVLYKGTRYQCRGIKLTRCSGEMLHNNATGAPKASGARCVLILDSGLLTLIDHAPA